jgi:archaeal flagellin FlaB
MVNKILRSLRVLRKDQRGITGLETAIILIAFVTVASVLGYSVLSAGIFSAEKGKQAVYQGLSQAQASMQVKGSVYATVDDSGATPAVTAVTFTLASVLNDETVDLTDTTGDNTMIINYTDSNGSSGTNVSWTATQVGGGNDDSNLDANEQMQIVVDLSTVIAPAQTLGVYDSFTLQIIPAKGAAITLQRTLPSMGGGTIDLN